MIKFYNVPAHNFMSHQNPTHLRVFILTFIVNYLLTKKTEKLFYAA